MTKSLLGVLFLAAATLATAAELRGVMVVGVTDGVTITVRDGKQNYKVRLAGIDTPEKGQPFAKRAHQNLSNLAHEKQAIIDCYKIDQYKRKVCRVWVGGNDIALAQLQAGLAWHFKRFENDQTQRERVAYAQAENEARSRKWGLWQDKEPVPPWEFRKKR